VARQHTERHRTERVGWRRAAVLGANDGILSTASLVLGVAAAHGNHRNVLVAGVAALFAGAMSMAAGEYVSVHSHAEKAIVVSSRSVLGLQLPEMLMVSASGRVVKAVLFGSKCAPDARYCRLGHSCSLGHRPSTEVRFPLL
jgi:hypothetical protein